MERSDKQGGSREGETSDEGKPLKKARYLWEIKGKGHLKTSKDPSSSFQEAQLPVDFQKPCCSKTEPTTSPKADSGPKSSCCDDCCLETFLAKTEDIMVRDSSDDDDSEKLPLENSIENEIPVTLVSAQPKNQDYYLKKWQARQIARGFVDNTINSMLENWVDRPFDATNFVEDCANDGQVEDDAILMAIQSHGLQSGLRGSTSGTLSTSTFNSNSNSSFNSNLSIAGSSRSESQSELLYSSQILQESSTDNLENLQKEQETQSLSSSMSPASASSISNTYEGDSGDPMDFLNAAVSVAIQKKGLSY
ncbi:serine-rich adhesin for platelets-like isoform X1 [Euwallacea similis]|uniref:serine-rich adhesin for platelets-like isoform X1 n=1 Tax=Euwallacea similis TaxID=1736056 RepID=UPI00344E65F8